MVKPGLESNTEDGFNNTPLTELSVETRRQLACMLNRKKVLRSEEGFERDWRGIATLSGVHSYVEENDEMPMDMVINRWIEMKPKSAKVGHLEKFLGAIDRWDVFDDIQENLEKDTNRYIVKQQQQKQCSKVYEPSAPAEQSQKTNNNSLGQDVNIVSIDDVRCLRNGLPLPKYNACVLYAEADIEHAIDIMNNLESGRFNFKLFLRYRDLLLGVPFEHVEMSHFMATRCNHLIVVITEEFLKSRENTFLVNFTQKLQIAKNSRKIIPILYNPNMKLPLTLTIYTHINYFESSSLITFWNKLANSLNDLDSSSIYTHQPQTPTAPEFNSLPETPHILANDTGVTDLPHWKFTESKEEPISVKKTLPLPELKVMRKNRHLQRSTSELNILTRNSSSNFFTLTYFFCFLLVVILCIYVN